MSAGFLGRTQLGEFQLGAIGPTMAVLIDTETDLEVSGGSQSPNSMPPFPNIKVYMAFENNPTAVSPTWTDITLYVKSISTRRGRSNELDRFETGTATIVLRNPDRRFDPSYASSPYAPYIKPMRRVKVVATVEGLEYPIFHGFTENWELSWEVFEGTVAVSCSDVFKVLALRTVSDSYPQELSGARIERVLNDIGWSTEYWSLEHPQLSVLGSTTVLAGSGDNARVVYNGLTEIMADTLAQEAGLAHAQAVTQAENGRFWVRADGVIVFLGRTESDSNQPIRATFGDRVGELYYASLVPQYGEDMLYNHVEVTRVGGAKQTAEDLSSMNEYLRRDLVRSNMLMSTNTEAEASAQWLLGTYVQPQLRFTSMTLEGRARWGLWRYVLDLDIGSRVLVRRRPDGVTSPIEQSSVIEGVSHDIDAESTSWTTSWDLSPAKTTQRWLLEDPTYSVLGTTTILSY